MKPRALVPLLFLLAAPAGACTTFLFDGPEGPVFGRNYDWSVEDGFLVTNKRGAVRFSARADDPATWVSRYGSVTFNQYGRGIPMGGMNEAGLVVECMWLRSTVYPEPDDRPAVGELGWVQFQLDNAATVGEVVAKDSLIRIDGGNSSPLHFLVSDREGGCAAIEFLGGKSVVHREDGLPWRALANSEYAASLAHIEEGATGGDAEKVGGAPVGSSLRRFEGAARGAARLDSLAAGAPVDSAFALLGRVASSATMWSVVYDPAAERIYWKTASTPAVRSVDLGRLDFTCGSEVRIFPVTGPGAGDVTGAMEPYTTAANLDLIRRTYAATSFLRAVPDSVLRAIAAYPEGFVCAGEE